MTLEAKDKLICDMVKENPDSTIRDYLDLLSDIESIEIEASKREPTKLKMEQLRDKTGRFLRVHWLPLF